MILRCLSVRSAFIALTVLSIALATSESAQAGSNRRETRKPVLTKTKFDPTAERVELFKAMEDGLVETKVSAKDATGGVVYISNTSDKPLTVELPESFVAVQVLKQFGGGGLGGGGGGLGGGGLGGGGLGGGGGQGGGQNQQQGGGFGGGQGGGGLGGGQGGGGLGGGQGGGGGFFSIPPERTVKVPYIGACLNHGKIDPNPRVEYKLVRVTEYTEDPILTELIRMLGTGRINQHSAQAAIWTRTDNMSWQQLAEKGNRNFNGVIEYYFTPQNISAAQLLVATAEGNVREAAVGGESESSETAAPRVR